MSKKKNKVYYEVDYIPTPIACKVSDLMAECDLGIDAIFVTEEFCLTTTTKITKTYIAKMKKAIWQAIEQGGGRPLKITYKPNQPR